MASEQLPIDETSIARAYDGQVRQWQAPEEVHSWIAHHFTYDDDRAMALSETQRARGLKIRIYEADEFYQTATGTCVDLSRFAVETLRKVAPDSSPKYLRINFDPVRINGNLLRMHWIASFIKDEKYYFFADSYYPEKLFGPYDDLEEFIANYQDARGRTILSYNLVDSFRKQPRKMQRKSTADQQSKTTLRR
jgi:hypothetical protein